MDPARAPSVGDPVGQRGEQPSPADRSQRKGIGAAGRVEGHALLPSVLAVSEQTSEDDVRAVLPPGHGVVRFLSADGCPLLTAATSDIREFIIGRLAAVGRNAQLAPVTDRVRFARAGSGFESDLLFLRVLCNAVADGAGGRGPDGKLLGEVRSARSAWFAVPVSHEGVTAWEPRRLSASALGGCARAPKPARRGGVVEASNARGPWRTKAEAAAAAAALTEAFGLSHTPALDARRWDEAERLEHEEAAAASMDGGGAEIDAATGRARRRMEEAASRLDFEAAARHKASLAVLEGAPPGVCRWSRGAWLVAGPAPASAAGGSTRKAVRVWLVSAGIVGGAVRVLDAPVQDGVPIGAAEPFGLHAAETPDVFAADAVLLVADHAARRRSGVVVRRLQSAIGPPGSAGLAAEIEAAARAFERKRSGAAASRQPRANDAGGGCA